MYIFDNVMYGEPMWHTLCFYVNAERDSRGNDLFPQEGKAFLPLREEPYATGAGCCRMITFKKQI